MTNPFEKLVRQHLLALNPYSTARDEFSGEALLFLDANENPYDSDLNRYPDPFQSALRNEVASIKGVSNKNLFISNGSDEAIDLLIRVFCEPGNDKIAYFMPTYGMYGVSAATHAVGTVELLLNEDFEPDVDALAELDGETKILFLCSPNNPTGNLFSLQKLHRILNQFHGIVVVDEAYIDFSDAPSAIKLLNDYPQLVVLQTFSKAWGLAAARMGVAMAHQWIIQLMDKVKLPYNINSLSAGLLLKRINEPQLMKQDVQNIIMEREKLAKSLSGFSFVEKIFPSDANFLLVRFKDGNSVYTFLLSKGIVVRNRTNQPLLKNCLRITIGTAAQNSFLLEQLNTYTNE